MSFDKLMDINEIKTVKTSLKNAVSGLKHLEKLCNSCFFSGGGILSIFLPYPEFLKRKFEKCWKLFEETRSAEIYFSIAGSPHFVLSFAEKALLSVKHKLALR